MRMGQETLTKVHLTKVSDGEAKAFLEMARKHNDSDCHNVSEKKPQRDIDSPDEEINAFETEETRKRCLKLASIIAASELPWSMAIQEAEQELSDLIKRVDSQTKNEVAKRIRGFS
jgi:hypothetical protein